jgi:TRAP-type C4-dicarboxylate transport system substrate-binding protein
MLTAAGLAKIDPIVNAFQQIPLMYRSLDEVDFVRSRLDSTISQRLREKGFVVLFWGDAGWLRFFSKAEGLRPHEFEQMKFFVSASNADEVDLMTKAGWTPVPLELSDALTGLRTGMVEVLPTVPFHALAGQFYTTTPHMLELNWAPLVGAMVVTADLWDQLPPESRDCLRLAAEEAGENIKARGRKENDDAVAAMRNKHGLQVHSVSPALEAEWRETARVFWPLIRGSLVPAEIFDEVERLLVEYRSSAPSQ